VGQPVCIFIKRRHYEGRKTVGSCLSASGHIEEHLKISHEIKVVTWIIHIYSNIITFLSY
jgi:hypothetical protein